MARFRCGSQPRVNFESEQGGDEEGAGGEAGGSLCLWGEEDWVPKGRGGAGRGEERQESGDWESWATFLWELQPSEEPPLGLVGWLVFRVSQDPLCRTTQDLPATIIRISLKG